MRCLSAALVILSTIAFTAFADLTGKPLVIDGDTIEIAGERIRLHGIDAPETEQTCKNADGKDWECGRQATWALARIIEFHWLTCKGETRDGYGRLIAKCYAGPYDVGERMVREGWALAYRRFSQDYVDEEAEDKAARRGVWRGPFTAPWDWRR